MLDTSIPRAATKWGTTTRTDATWAVTFTSPATPSRSKAFVIR